LLRFSCSSINWSIKGRWLTASEEDMGTA